MGGGSGGGLAEGLIGELGRRRCGIWCGLLCLYVGE